MPTVQPFGMHRQAWWKERADDTDLSLWFRVVAMAYAHHRANGHATFAKTSELASLLGVQPNRVSEAIGTAKKHKLLAPESHSRCLIVPHNGVHGGLGNPQSPCPVHAGKRFGTSRKRVPPETGA